MRDRPGSPPSRLDHRAAAISTGPHEVRACSGEERIIGRVPALSGDMGRPRRPERGGSHGPTALGTRTRRRRLHRRTQGAVRIPWTFVLSVILSAEIFVWSGIATDWFGYGPPGSPSTGPPPPNLNPYDEKIVHVIAGVTYHGNSTSYFPALEGKDICNHCPGLPFIDYGFSPAVLGFWFEFNVTNDATWWELMANFTVATSGPTPGLFTPGIARCCYPSFESAASYAYLEANQTVGLKILVVAPSLADVGPSGYTLYFNVTSP